MNLTVNRLPSVTWNRLQLNEAAVSLEEELEDHIPRAEYSGAGLSWEEAGSRSLLLPGELGEITAAASLGCAGTAENSRTETPLVLSYDYAEGEKAASRLSLRAGAGSRLRVILVLSGRAELSVLQTEVLAGENAEVELFLVDLLGERCRCFNHIAGRLERHAGVKVVRLDLGGREIYSGMNMDLAGEGASFSCETGYHVRAGQLLDMNYTAVHRGRNTGCRMQVNGTLEEGAEKVFRGTVDFRRGCAGARAAENETVLLLGEKLRNRTLPVILCGEEDVEGSHGASIGQLDEKVLFYLATRGISAEAARAMIAQAGIDAVCSRIPSEELRGRVREFETARGGSHGKEL